MTNIIAAIAQLGERQTEDLKVPGSIPGGGIINFLEILLLLLLLLIIIITHTYLMCLCGAMDNASLS